MKKLKTLSDMGSIKVFNEGLSCFFDNGLGDGENTVEIKKFSGKGEFLGHFTVKDKAYLSESDCSDKKIHTFDKGRWFVYLIKTREFVISKVDEDLHA